MNGDEEVYFHQSCVELTMLVDHCANVQVDIISIPTEVPTKLEKIPVFKFRANDVDKQSDNTFTIHIESDQWPGTILICEIKGANFLIYEHSRVLVAKDSLLAKEFFDLYNKNEIFKISKIMYLIQQANDGFIDESISRFL